MTFAEILHQLGADDYPLTPAQCEQIDREGYLEVPDLFDPEQVAVMRATLEGLVHELGLGMSDFDGGYRMHDLIGRAAFDLAWAHPRMLSIARYWLKEEFKPMCLNYRCPLPGGGVQALHSDETPTPYCQAIIALCDLTPENGAPRVVPGSHRLSTRPCHEMSDLTATHPREMKFIARAGSALFFDGNLWHSGTHNSSDQPRPVLHSGFMSRFANSSGLERQRGVISPATYDRMSAPLRNFLDFRVHDEEYERMTKPYLAPIVA
jgi:hypothetical protein